MEQFRKRFENLSPRQQEVALLLVDGLTNQEVAECLDVTLHTVKAHRAECMRRMEAYTFADLVCRIQSFRANQTNNHTGPLRIIVVEDDQWYREYLTDNLIENSFLVVGVSDGKAFDDAWQVSQPDIVILDIELGLNKEDGMSIASRLLGNSNCGVIMVTSHGETEDRMKGLLIGVDAYLSKPVNINELTLTITNLGRRLRQSHPLSTSMGNTPNL